MKRKNEGQSRGITLIALIITIIILLILAGVAINMVLGQNGLLNNAKEAQGKYINEQEKEKNMINAMSNEINLYDSDNNKDEQGCVDGLILWLDGMNNTESGHDETKTETWYDLASEHNNATLYNCEIGENYIYLNGQTSYGILPEKALGDKGESTIEVVVEPEDVSGIIVADNLSSSTRCVGFCRGDLLTSVGEGNRYTFKSINDILGRHVYTVIFDKDNSKTTKMYQDGVEQNISSEVDGYSNSAEYPLIGRRFYGAGPSWAYKGKVYSIRVYNRALTENEIQINYILYKNKFNL